MRHILTFATAFILIPLLDYFWIGLLMKNFYIQELGALGRTENGTFTPLLWSAAVVYLAIAMGIVVFVLPMAAGDIKKAFLLGAVLGACIYATYDFTNLSTLQNWSLKFTLVDVAWGTFLCAVNSAIVCWADIKLEEMMS